ncbi:MAG: pilus assembly protein [Legionellales bacterium]|nr:pilus assembly protein [Legionellales bacterium]|tara:strand:- start:10238 stop:10675 length:438 start_codon:yes stop_codon:yes gene_type:complete
MMKRFNRAKGFTLVELLTAIAIVGILASIAIPTFQEYTRKARYSELVQTTSSYQTAVGICYNRTGGLNQCFGGQNGIPANIINSSSTGLVRYLFTLGNGRIFVFPNNQNGFTLLGDYLIATPTVSGSMVTWQYSGPAVTNGWVTQ